MQSAASSHLSSSSKTSEYRCHRHQTHETFGSWGWGLLSSGFFLYLLLKRICCSHFQAAEIKCLLVTYTWSNAGWGDRSQTVLVIRTLETSVRTESFNRMVISVLETETSWWPEEEILGDRKVDYNRGLRRLTMAKTHVLGLERWWDILQVNS